MICDNLLVIFSKVSIRIHDNLVIIFPLNLRERLLITLFF
jgi:hypothetical protein